TLQLTDDSPLLSSFLPSTFNRRLSRNKRRHSSFYLGGGSVNSPSSLSPIRFAGWIRKQSVLGIFVATAWRKRFAVLTSLHLHLFNSDAALDRAVASMVIAGDSEVWVSERGVFVLKVRGEVATGDEGTGGLGALGGTSSSSPASSPPSSISGKVKGKESKSSVSDKKTWSLQCANKEQMIGWLSAIRAVIATRQNESLNTNNLVPFDQDLGTVSSASDPQTSPHFDGDIELDDGDALVPLPPFNNSLSTSAGRTRSSLRNNRNSVTRALSYHASLTPSQKRQSGLSPLGAVLDILDDMERQHAQQHFPIQLQTKGGSADETPDGPPVPAGAQSGARPRSYSIGHKPSASLTGSFAMDPISEGSDVSAASNTTTSSVRDSGFVDVNRDGFTIVGKDVKRMSTGSVMGAGARRFDL
ncbi:hypothetical protein HK102_002985, partial [Quaeritorhiza haematococci]